MSRRRISQAEARAAIKRVAELEAEESRRRFVWALDWPGGVHIGSVEWNVPALVCEAALTARKLGHAIVVLPDDSRKKLMLYALPLPAAGRVSR